jgi:ceramide glucosyltransferase
VLTHLLAAGCAGLAGAGIVQSASGYGLLRRKQREVTPTLSIWPAITVLKPLCGDETLLETALSSFCAQDYPNFQIVFGVQNAADPALVVVDRLRRLFPRVAIDVVIDARRHGRNSKVSNLINMFPFARHDVIVIADSDIHASPDTLRSVAGALMAPGVGLVTTLYTGLPASNALAGALAAAQINHSFLPGALMARSLGRQDCLGAIMALRRETLGRIGGLESLADHLADDALLGQLVRDQGLSVALASAIPATTVPETRLPALVSHELRWMRTVKSVAPVGFVLGAMQYPLFWATLMLAAEANAPMAWMAFVAIWLARGILAERIDRLLQTTGRLSVWYLPFRDVLSVVIMVASYWSNRVAWRGQEHRVTSFSEAVLQPGKG